MMNVEEYSKMQFCPIKKDDDYYMALALHHNSVILERGGKVMDANMYARIKKVRDTKSKLGGKHLEGADMKKMNRGFGYAGLDWFEKSTNLKGYYNKEQLPYPVRFKETGIVQFANDKYKNKVIKSYTQIDRNSAYLSILANEKLPFEYDRTITNFFYNPREDEILLYEKPSGIMTFDRPEKLTGVLIHVYYAYRLNCKKLLKEFEHNKKIDKETAKKLIVSGIGILSNVNNMVVTQYIWYKQGQEMLKQMNAVARFGGTVIKCHTDSIGFEHSNVKFGEYLNLLQVLKANRDGKIGDWKIEADTRSIYMVHQAMYQIQGKFPKGFSENILPEEAIEFGWLEKNKDNRRYSRFSTVREIAVEKEEEEN